jgi:Mycothiol maleylpyruvate isomerase N-terminal domain
MKAEFADQNRASTEALKTLISGLSESEFATRVGNGWTVATLLCHMALWDGRVAYTLQTWQKSGQMPSGIPKDATDIINLASRDVFAAMPGSAAADVVVKRAESLDAWLATLDDSFCEQVLAGGAERMLRRSLHRSEHLKQIRESLAK